MENSENKRAKATEMLEEWYSTPDERGDDYWDDLARETACNRIQSDEEG